jgi:peptide/nickel transport system permease protein
MTTTVSESPVEAVRPKRLLRRVVGQRPARVAAVWLLFVVLLAVLAPLVARYSPYKPDIYDILSSPSRKHWLGTDSAGRDVWSRMVFGTRTSLLGALLVLAIALSLGAVSGLVAGYFAGRIDAALTWVSAAIMAMPGIVVLLAIRAVLGGCP